MNTPDRQMNTQARAAEAGTKKRHEDRNTEPVPVEILERQVLKDGSLRRIQFKGRIQEMYPDEETVPGKVNVYLPDSLVSAEQMPSNAEDREGLLPIVVFLHGMGSDSRSKSPLLYALRDAGHVVIAPTTSRRENYRDDATQERYDTLQDWVAASFKGKGFYDEEEDYVRGIEAGRAELRQVLDELGMNIEQEKIELILIGHSYGGMVAADIAPRYKPDQLLLVSPSLQKLERDPATENLLGAEHPMPEEVLHNSQSAKEITVLRGSEDNVISEEECLRYVGATGTYVEVPGADHRIKFSGVRDDADARKKRETALFDAIKKIVYMSARHEEADTE